MFTVLFIMLLGVGVGWLLRGQKLSFVSKVVSVLIYLLLFVLGSQVGANEAVMDNLSSIGVDALVITLGSLLGSLLAARFVYIRFFKGRKLEKGGVEDER